MADLAGVVRVAAGVVQGAVAVVEAVVAAAVVVAADFEDSIRRSLMGRCFIREETGRWMRRTIR